MVSYLTIIHMRTISHCYVTESMSIYYSGIFSIGHVRLWYYSFPKIKEMIGADIMVL